MPHTKQKLFLKFIALLILITLPIALVFVARSDFFISHRELISYTLIGLAICLGISLAIIDPFPFKKKNSDKKSSRTTKY